jgi:hypothetical protein
VSVRGWSFRLDEIRDQSEVLRVPCQQRDTVDVCGRGDHQIERAPPWFPPTTDDSCGEPTPFASDGRIDREGIEGGLDDAEPLRPSRSLVLRVGNKDAEVQLGERCNADPTFEVTWALRPDENRRIEEGPHLFGEEIGDFGRELREVIVERLWRGRVPDSLQRGALDPLVRACGAEAGDRTARDGDGELLAGFGSP